MKTYSDEDRNPALNEGKWHQDRCGTRIQLACMCMVYNMHNLIFYNELISDLKVIPKFVMHSNIKHLDLIVMYA